MIKEFTDMNLVTVVMTKGTDQTYTFIPKLVDGSTFVFSEYDLVCEGRISNLQAKLDYTFPVEEVDLDGEPALQVSFPKEILTDEIRYSKLIWRVIGTDKEDGKSFQIKYGAIELT